MAVNIQRHVRHAAGLHWQYREAGAPGVMPTLVLLHPSPRSSAMYEPWMLVLGQHFHVLAIDTPGYGGSDPLPGPPIQLLDYVAPLHALLQQLLPDEGRAGCLLYGSATGAQLGIAYVNAYVNAYAKADTNTHPQLVRHLLLDNAAHFDGEERTRILAQYFPDLTPRPDGSHLATAWQMCAQMLEFFPWFDTQEAQRIAPGPATPAVVHAAVQELLAAGPGYADAYRAAFEHERAAHVQALRVPTSLLRWQGSILLRHIDRLLQHPLPANVQVVDIPAPLAARYSAMTAHLLSLVRR